MCSMIFGSLKIAFPTFLASLAWAMCCGECPAPCLADWSAGTLLSWRPEGSRQQDHPGAMSFETTGKLEFRAKQCTRGLALVPTMVSGQIIYPLSLKRIRDMVWLRILLVFFLKVQFSWISIIGIPTVFRILHGVKKRNKKRNTTSFALWWPGGGKETYNRSFQWDFSVLPLQQRWQI